MSSDRQMFDRYIDVLRLWHRPVVHVATIDVVSGRWREFTVEQRAVLEAHGFDPVVRGSTDGQGNWRRKVPDLSDEAVERARITFMAVSEGADR